MSKHTAETKLTAMVVQIAQDKDGDGVADADGQNVLIQPMFG